MAQKNYPVGNNRFGTVAPLVTDAFHIDFGAQTTGTANLRNYPAGTQLVTWAGRIAEAAESGSAGTIQFGITGSAVLLSSALATGAMTLGDWIGPSSTHVINGPVLLAADDTFDIICATDSYTAGKIDVYVTYIPLPKDALDTDVFHVYLTT